MNALTTLDTLVAEDLEMPRSLGATDYRRIARAIETMVAAAFNGGTSPGLAELAAQADLSPFHFQRLFKRWAGVSPKQFARFLTLEHAKTTLEQSASVLNAAFDVGLSGGSRLHDLFVAVEAMTPGEYKAQGRDLVIRHGVHDTPFGPALILVTDRGVCGFDFIAGSTARALKDAKARWPLSRFVTDDKATAAVAAKMFTRSKDMRLLLRGTNFQLQVWAALLRIPPANISTYGAIAEAIGKPKAVRAVGTALASNPIGYLVPCHRVLRSTGLFKNYRWGAVRRHAMLAWEAANNQLI
ncbi:MAG: methylated-DNA--[protein]-cysteine S-methyltransferase [Rhodospirillaceae bacterium]|nr:methylated-DNA--[protein]-cysteine S-methyltransferase [Rhodospirillaceae bacterium]